MPCTTLSDLCSDCGKEYTGILKQNRTRKISLHTGIYPVAFRAKFAASDIPADHAINIAHNIEDTLSEVFGMDIPVLAYASIPTHPSAEENIWVSILIEFPEEDGDLIFKIFGDLGGVPQGWECLVPQGCVNAFFLRWHRDPMVDLALTRPAGPRSGTSTRTSEGQGPTSPTLTLTLTL
ncbi:hypothetical protein BJX76DRAFT_358773 [Aspergillus varians]